MKVLIVEDEHASARNLQDILMDIGQIEVIDVLDSIEDSVDWFSSNAEPDVLFLDIHLADGSSFEIFNQVDIACPIIFTTAYDEHALEAFQVNSVSYLLKPIKQLDVEEALDKLRLLQGKSSWMDEIRELKRILYQKQQYKSHLLVSLKDDKLLPLSVEQIAYINIEEGVVKIHTHEGKRYFPDSNLDELASMLDPTDFYRANRQYIISRRALKDVDAWFNHRLAVNLKLPVEDRIIVSKARVSDFKNWLSGG
ncbi:MAG: LytTR family DNA-binding domain-containing protein [Cyclobacteriaceae bacterium]